MGAFFVPKNNLVKRGRYGNKIQVNISTICGEASSETWKPDSGYKRR